MSRSRFVVVFLVLSIAMSMILASSVSAEADYSNMSLNELLQEQEKISTALWANDEWEEVTVPNGVYRVGVDIPAGRWTISASSGVSYLFTGMKLDETGNSLAAPYTYQFVSKDDSSWPESVTWELLDGAYFVVQNRPAVFTTPSSASLGFGGKKEETSSNDSSDLIAELQARNKELEEQVATLTEQVGQYEEREASANFEQTESVDQNADENTQLPVSLGSLILTDYSLDELELLNSRISEHLKTVAPEKAGALDNQAAENDTSSPLLSGTTGAELIASITKSLPLLSRDEIKELQTIVDDEAKERDRQWAIENGNRIISVAENEITVGKGKSIKVSPEVIRVTEEAPAKTQLLWTTDNNTVATVSNGQIKGVGAGDCTIICYAKDDELIKSEITVHVIQEVKSLKFEDKNLTVPVGETITSAVTIMPEDATNKALLWESSDDEVVSVDAEGKITALSGGDATITVIAADGGEVKATLLIHVPTFVVGEDSCKFESLTTLDIPVKLFGISADDIVVSQSSKVVSVEIINGETLRITPQDSGTGNIGISCGKNKVDKAVVSVEVTKYAITDLQDMLTSLGTYTAGQTGKVDQKTKEAIKSAQSMLGLEPDGSISESFISLLKKGIVLEPKELDGRKPLNEVFPDENLAMAIRNSLGLISISQEVDQSILDKCEKIVIEDDPVQSLAGIEYLRNLEKFVAECTASWHMSTRNTAGPCKYTALNVTSIRPLMACKKLKYISIHGTPFTSIPREIGDLAELETLVIEYGSFETLPEELCQCTNLETLAFEKTPLISLPENIGNLKNLTQLRLEGTRISTLPDSIGEMSSMTSFLCENSDFSTLPDSFGNLVNLTRIDLSGNIYLTALPESMENLVKLSNLDLSNCKKLKSLPTGLQNLLVNNNATVNLEKTSIK